jgi:ABC-type transport system involved in cytochrome bd biosynthesis fused ATPase/permease subunit
MFLPLIAIAWLYVALMMAVAEASSPIGSLLGAIVTFLLYGLGPVLLLLYILGTPLRKKLRRLRESKEEDASAATAGQNLRPAREDGPASTQPDAGGHAAADTVTPVRKEP